MPGVLLTPREQSLLAEGVRRQEHSAEEELVRLFAARVSVLALARTRDRELARDLTQDVMLAVVLALRDGRLRDAERLAAFVYGTARNVINNYLRTRSREPRIDSLDVDLVAVATRTDPVESSERACLVRQALEILDATDRHILSLTLTEGLKPGEIAARLGLSSEVVRTRKSRALKKTVERLKRLSRR